MGGRANAAGLLMGRKAIAAHFGMSVTWVDAARASGELPAFKFGGAICVRLADLEAVIERLAEEAGAEQAPPPPSPPPPGRKRGSSPDQPRPRGGGLHTMGARG